MNRKSFMLMVVISLQIELGFRVSNIEEGPVIF